jgi:hypothetical protein
MDGPPAGHDSSGLRNARLLGGEFCRSAEDVEPIFDFGT